MSVNGELEGVALADLHAVAGADEGGQCADGGS